MCVTDGGSFSMSSYVAAKLQHQTGAVLIGSETGGGEAGSNAILTYNLTLPETKIRVNLPYYVINHDVNPTPSG
jgi:C-terminal processing protease CtpA/Prc